MAYEAEVLKGEHDNGITYFTIANATAVAKGTLMVMSEAATRTCLVHTAGTGKIPIGFAVEEKEANDGKTELAIQRIGLVNAYADDTVDEGDLLCAGAATVNQVEPINATVSNLVLRSVIGIALQAASANGKFLMRLRC